MKTPSITEMIDVLRRANVLFAADEAGPGLVLNMNDTFGYATADGEVITEKDVPAVYALWRIFSWDGVAWWVWCKRGQEPIPSIRDEILRTLGLRNHE